jgi:uncharacterized phage protein (TIGR01671 family)
MTNSRQIKFRTYFREQGVPPQMIYFHLDDFIRDECGLVVGQASLHCSASLGFSVEYYPIENMDSAMGDQLAKLSDTIWGADNSPLMQFTGLLDRDIREAYEGDIVEIYSCGAPIFRSVVTFEIGVFGVVDSRNSIGPIKFRNLSYYEGFRVLGNIHENPELL